MSKPEPKKRGPGKGPFKEPLKVKGNPKGPENQKHGTRPTSERPPAPRGPSKHPGR